MARVKSVKFFVFCMMPVTRSNPMPVSTCLAGNGEKVPSGLALNWMKTRFHISMQRASPLLTKRAFGVASGGQVNVDFAAWAAGAGFAHHPEIVFFVAVDDVDFGVEAGGGEFGGPKIIGFLVEVAGFALGFVGAIDGGVEAVCGEISSSPVTSSQAHSMASFLK